MKRPQHASTAHLPHVEAVTRRCEVCEWEGEVIQPAGDEPDCPWCHAPTRRIAALGANASASADDTGAKNPHAAALGRLGGAKGGRARARALSASQRRQIASRAARARWTTRKKKKSKR